MKKKLLRSLLLIGVFFVIIAGNVLAATCPSGCQCLNASQAKSTGYTAYCGGTQTICSYDQFQNPMYCYQKPTTTVTLIKPIVPTTTVFITVKPTTVLTTVAPVQCPSGCDCFSTASAQQYGYVYCSGKQIVCGYEQTMTALVPKYCYQKPSTTTVPPIVKCPATCTCLSQVQGKELGYPRCSLESNPCGYDQSQNYMFCYEKLTETAVPIQPCASVCTCTDIGSAERSGFSYCGGRQVVCGYDQAQNPFYCFQKDPLCPAGCDCLDPSSAQKMGISSFCGGEKKVCANIGGADWYCYERGAVVATPTSMGTTAEPVIAPPVTRLPLTEAVGLFPCSLSGKIYGFQHDSRTIEVQVQEVEYLGGSCSPTPPFTCFDGSYVEREGTVPRVINVTPVYAGDLLSHLSYRAPVNCTAIYNVIPTYQPIEGSCEWKGTWRYSKDKPWRMQGVNEENYDITYQSPDNLVPSIDIRAGSVTSPSRHRGEGNWKLSIYADDPSGIQRIVIRGNFTANQFTSDEKGPLERPLAGLRVPVSKSCTASPCDIAIPHYTNGKSVSFDLTITACDAHGNANTMEYHHTFPDDPGDLSILSVEPIQVAYGAPLVKDKATAFRARVASTFPYPVEINLRLILPDSAWGTVQSSGRKIVGFPVGWEYPEDWGKITIPPNARNFSIILPIIPDWKKNLTYSSLGIAGGIIRGEKVGEIYGPDVRIMPKPIAARVWFITVIDPGNDVIETDERNNQVSSPYYDVVTTRSWRFYVVKYRGGEAGNCAPYSPFAEAGAKEQLEHVLAVFPIADSKVEYAFAPDTSSMPCPHDRSLTCPYATEYTERDSNGDWNRDAFLAKIEDMAKENNFDFGIAIGCGGGGGAAGPSSAVHVGDSGGDGDFVLAHEFNHVIVPMGDIYSLDCYCSWQESYCELPSGDRFYCCYGTYDREKDYRENTLHIDPNRGCTVDCAQDESACNATCCHNRCLDQCSGLGGTVHGCPDGRTQERMYAAEGFWVNRWIPETGKFYFMDGPSGTNWMTLESTNNLHFLEGRDPTCPRDPGTAKDGYFNLIRSPRFVSDRDPEAILVRGTITSAGTVTLKPFIRLSEANLDLEPSQAGTFFIVLYDAQGKVLSRAGFTPSFYKSDPGGGVLDEVSFSYRVEWNNVASRVEVQDGGGHTLATRAVSAHPPEVQVLTPRGSEVWEIGKPATVTWKASDQDGDTLTYSVAISPDQGKTWLPLAIDLLGSQFNISSVGFSEGTYLIRVRASDGINAGEGLSDSTITVRALKATPAGNVAASILIAGLAIFTTAIWLIGRRRN